MTDRSGQYIDNYKLIRLLGRGTFGAVYLGEHISRKTRVAVKVLHAHLNNDAFYDFINEARIFRLQHPNIVSTLDFGIERTTGTPFLVMNYAPNGTLRRRHPRGTQVPLPRVVEYARQIAAALQYAHEENLVHRDVKPENMLVDEQGRVLLSDFGIAITSQSLSTASQPAREVVGTPHYMAVEQFLGQPDRATDQYALGIVVYEWLSGRCPFDGDFYELLSQHAQAPPPPLPCASSWYTPEVERIVMKALAKQPGDRFASVWEFATALEEQYNKVIVKHQVPLLPGQTKEDYLKEGNSLSDAQRYTEAIAAYSLALALAPDDTWVYHNRGLAYRQLHDYQKALADYGSALALDPNNASAYNNRGYVYALLGDYQKAIADYDRVLALEPRYVPAYINRANAYCALGLCARALSDYDRIIALEPDYALAYYNRGNAYDELGEYQKALADFDHAITLDPYYARAYTNRGYVYRTLGDNQKAIADFDRALELDPGNLVAYNGRGLTYSHLQAFAKAIADFDRALELDPNDRSVLSNKADLLHKLQEQKALAC